MKSKNLECRHLKSLDGIHACHHDFLKSNNYKVGTICQLAGIVLTFYVHNLPEEEV